MCAVVPVAIGVGAASLIGAGISAYGQYQAGQAEGEIAKNNATLARYEAADAKQRGVQGAAEVMAQGRRTAASARTVLAGSGVDMTVGAPASIPAVSMINAARDAARVKANEARRAWGAKNEAQDQMARAKIAKRAGVLTAAGTSLAGIGGAAGAGAGTYAALR
jgi:hypothetical protein